jgi:hypothetical protein
MLPKPRQSGQSRQSCAPRTAFDIVIEEIAFDQLTELHIDLCVLQHTNVLLQVALQVFGLVGGKHKSELQHLINKSDWLPLDWYHSQYD